MHGGSKRQKFICKENKYNFPCLKITLWKEKFGFPNSQFSSVYYLMILND